MFKSMFSQDEEKSIDLSLYPADEKWEEKYIQLMKDDFLSKKYNRSRRINDHIEYLKTFTPEIFTNNSEKGLYVVDIGPGPGELLEICRALGYETKGYDAKIDDCEMGEPYIELSRHMSERQKIDIEYCGFENILSNLPLEDNSTFMINSRGSIEQVFKDHLTGVPHKIHHNARNLTWTFSEKMKEDFKSLFEQAKRVLVPGGIFLIYGNGSTNISEYHEFIISTLDEIEGIYCEASDSQTIHKMRKK